MASATRCENVQKKHSDNLSQWRGFYTLCEQSTTLRISPPLEALHQRDEDKGYGFSEPDEGGEDLFVHHTSIEGSGFRSLEEGERVSYEPSQRRKGPQAEYVSKV